ncbi:hypothetical protein CHH75_14505 [Paenibacillus sp. 7541]|nr:hypothetical protein CHH75_14505 [Paenibacillus sp. 7541]
MLPDRERKLLRILINYPSPLHQTRMPNWDRLETMTGRSQQEIRASLNYLEEHGYIIWPDKSTTKEIQIIKIDVLKKSRPKQKNTEYWTRY